MFKKFHPVKGKNIEFYPFRLGMALIILIGIGYFLSKCIPTSNEAPFFCHLYELHMPSEDEIKENIEKGKEEIDFHKEIEKETNKELKEKLKEDYQEVVVV